MDINNFNNMDTNTLHNLLYRSGELEAELRYVKEQLAEARNANQFLLARLSAPSSDTYSESKINASLQQKYERAIHENVRLKAQLGLAPSVALKGRIGIRPSYHRRRDSVASISEASREGTQATVDELLSFEEDDTSALETTLLQPVSHDTVTTLTPKKPEKKRDTFGLGIAHSFSADTNDDLFDQDHPPTSHRQKLHGFEIKYGDGTSAFVPTPITAPIEPVAPLPFHNAEHMRMMGMACFLEDQTPEERDRAWHRHAVNHPRHNGYEYIQYYEEVIRPAYLEKMKARGQAQGNARLATASPQAEVDHEPEREKGEPIDQELEASDETMEAKGNETQPSEVDSVSPKPADPASFDHLTVITAKEDLPPKSVGIDADTSPQVVLEVPHQLALSTHAEQKAPQEVQRAVDSDLQLPLQHDTAEAPPRFQHRDRALGQRPRFIPRGPQELEELFATSPPENIHTYRAVTISNIPKSATLHDVLSNIRCGRIFSAILHDTAGFRTNPPMETNVVTVTFTSGKDTKDFLKSCETNSTFTLPTTHATFEAAVALIPTITRPLPPWIISKMKLENLSRVLYIHDPEKTFPLDRVVEEMMRGGARKPLKESFDAEVPGLMLFEFASLQEAVDARRAMEKNFNFFGKIGRGFSTDPCEKAKGSREGGVGLGEEAVEAGGGGEELLMECGIKGEGEVEMVEG
ncbi:uncharacterized protein MYCFIDRAFT_198517 [Pseudocercospora fijiensis CIRAD86]|uniref:Uncharacterized protein n=1 Tax=Pseudocercospora fijiensis (strain CIRAD86) TaxID=383855 RepID=M3ASX9_PSEFD|nr:uncharacterized protein MYCFIDRAFT_198517 [Pseudocercospora fijiensis CIRAD86]EME80233.1 hypothetical protein MYCFIDRAFT_198517 [Pseudocercospora fijiensis CIRAD86]